MNTTTNMNGKARKSLSSQIDRLDAVLDGLADNLNQAIAAAVQEAVALAVREAVQVVLTEVLTQRPLLAQLRATPTAQATDPTPPAAPPGWLKATFGRLGAGLAKATAVVVAGCRCAVSGTTQAVISATQAVATRCRLALSQTWQTVASIVDRICSAAVIVVRHAFGLTVMAWQQLQVVRRCKLQLLAALAVGAAAGTAAYYTAPLVAAVTSGIGGFAAVVLVQTWLLLHRMFAVISADD